ncbi:Guanine nucleotide-binding protein G(k) subunit alpha [Strongyloides ratti]|uniref:Guanine nucleotide-binding protein G(K) subunit alpha n=1 Tax=Strongyloides ratti TaxID=34506 RepID=A0A090LGP2_STRRB|nr:Guanine nucleotide-binding protein G(k) subunit alpha [Strongyloides ratti]CEF68966.1 Guanine nucleotide-binding protein G(k) subunit alpha [Strongyloides ratti]
MGALTSACQNEESKEEIAKNKAIEKQIMQDKRAGASIIKLLLLGAGECGKSTVLKQMQLLHSSGFTEEEINERKAVVYSNVISSMATILRAMDNVLQLPIENSSLESDKEIVLNVMERGEEQQPFTDEVAKALQNLWQDPAVKKAYDMRSEFQLNDSAKYFLDSISRIHEPGYRPTEQDILFSRVATTGVVEVKFKIKDLDFRVFDVGGQRSERRKWIHAFDNVESIIFITAVSEYDQVLFEDETTNRMIESMQLFSSICNSSWFQNTAMILFMNKKDLFAEKIQRVNITTAFPDYEGGQNYDEAISFIKLKFSELNQHPDKKTIYMHETCATDTNQVQLVISSCIDLIIQKNLQKAGML